MNKIIDDFKKYRHLKEYKKSVIFNAIVDIIYISLMLIMIFAHTHIFIKCVYLIALPIEMFLAFYGLFIVTDFKWYIDERCNK
jgi:hypothetical protein